MSTTSSPRVLAILVAHDGLAWLGETIDALEAQDLEELEILAVDNGSADGSRDLLIERLGHDRVLVAERDLGFGAAVSMALDSAMAAHAEHLLLVHDDCALAPDAARLLSDALAADPHLAAVGPKLVDWDDPRRLQTVGMTVDVTGRADSGLEPDELDQGQRDIVRPVLYVPTTAMMVRRDAFERLGRFDRRYHIFRDDLDLCWRAWLTGYDVEVHPAAEARHAQGASNYLRLGQTAFIGPRYFAERNTLATLLKTYQFRRLLGILPLFLLVGLAKVLGFVATRRLSDAWQTLRAWAWNVVHLRETWRLRQTVQEGRQRTDAEVRPLFAKVAPRLRAYVEAVVDWLAGGEVNLEEAPPDAAGEPATATRRAIEYVRRRPVLVAAVLLLAVGIVVSLPLLQSGQLRGGELGAWPSSASEFLRAYGAGWHDVGGVGTAIPPSPAQGALGVLTLLAGGSSWLATRLLVLGALPLAWLLALRAGSIVTERRPPRLAAATAYVLSPPVLAALVTARVSVLVLVVLLPALVSAAAAMVDMTSSPARAWRATSATALVAAVIIAFVPPAALLLLAGAVITAALVPLAIPDASTRIGALVRIAAVIVGTFLLLSPWSITLVRSGSPVFDPVGPTGAQAQPFWRWLALTPDLVGFAGVLAGLGFVIGGVLGIVFGFRQRPWLVGGLWATALLGAVAAWGLGRAGTEAFAWPGVPLVLVSLALALLLAVAFASFGERLGEHTFGWRQLASLLTAFAVLLGMGVSGATLLDDPWDAYAIGEGSLPAFIEVDRQNVGEFRVLVMADQDGVIEWDLTGADGSTMLRFGQAVPDTLETIVSSVVSEMMGGADPGAAGRLGLASIRYVFVPEGGRSAALDRALGDQLDLEPQPVANGRVYRVSGWVPKAVLIPLDAVEPVLRRGEIPPGTTVTSLEHTAPATYVGEAPRPGSVLLADVTAPGWEAYADGVALEARPRDGMLRFEVPEAAARVEITYARQGRRTGLLLIQLVLVLVALSLVLRPPGFAEEQR